MSIELQRAHPDDVWLRTPGRWRPAKLADGRRTATISCPVCGRSGSLADHEIDADGTVRPSVVCPYADPNVAQGEPLCGFHQHVRLLEWGT